MQPVFAAASQDVAVAFVELGAIILGLAVLARLSDRMGISPIPAYLVAGVVFGDGGLTGPKLSENFIELAAEIGVVLLLLTLGLEYSAQELAEGARTGWLGGIVDLTLNATPGVVCALLLGWGVEAAVVLGGVTYISSSGVIAKVLTDLGRLGNRETPTLLTLLVIEDLVMAVYLPITVVMLAGASIAAGILSVGAALAIAGTVLVLALRFGDHITRLLDARSDEALLLGVIGLTLLVAGITQQLDVSAAVGAFLVGIAISGPVGHRVANLVNPLRDLFAALFFILFGFRIDPAQIPDVLPIAVALLVVASLTKIATGWWATKRVGIANRGRMRAGTALIARGEFSIVIAGLALGTGLEEDLVPLAATFVLLTAIAGPILTKFADTLAPKAKGPRPDPSPAPSP
ncbi:MAG TPA: cation:proton antiporter [Acidimicrobiia bacterium]|nr:cation:proton antiporter [Acidimicrobiia bacterium]